MMRTSLARRLLTFLDVFARREDVVVLEHQILEGLGREGAEEFGEEWGPVVGDEIVRFAQEIGGLTFTWALASRARDREDFSEGSRGGRLAIRSFAQLRVQRNDGGMPARVAAFAAIDDMVAEGRGGMARHQGHDDGWRMVFEDASANRIVEIGTWAEYLARGARSAFSWYWQVDDAEGSAILASLRGQSLPASTPPARVRARLRDMGVDEAVATDLVDWLGPDATLLFTR